MILREKERIIQVACGSIHTLARSNLHRIFSCGNGSTFALGHNSRDSCPTFRQIEFFNGNDDQGITGAGFKTIACGLTHSGCVLTDGSVYLWGVAGDVQFSKEYMEKCLLKKPTKISFRGDGQALSHRRRSNPTLDDSGTVFIEDLKLGEQFSMVLTNKGAVYTWGLNDKGQLGLGNELPTVEPTLVSSLTKVITKIDCGLKHCVALTKDYQLYLWGSNLQSQLGKKSSQQHSSTP